jgi:hypothetical protein
VRVEAALCRHAYRKGTCACGHKRQ